MNLTPLRANMTEIDTPKYRVLFSYRTPVAYYDYSDHKYVKTEKYWSRTTSKHINQWLDGNKAELITQEELDNLLNEVK